MRLLVNSTVAALATAAFLLFIWAMAPNRAVAAECGTASFYAEAHHGKTMANGKPFNMHAMTAASNSLPLGARARVTAGRKHVDVTITDTGGFGKYGRILDLSKTAFAKLAPISQGLVKVCLERL